MKQSPTSRSLALLRSRGFTCAIVEKFVRFPPPGHRVDLFGVIDILALLGGTVAVQTTTAANMAARKKKIRESPAFEAMCRAHWLIVVHGWRKGGARGKRKTWICNEEVVTL